MVIVVLLRSLEADQLLVGSIAALTFGGIGLLVFWQLGERHHQGTGSSSRNISIRALWGERETIERIGRLVTAGIWYAGGYLLYWQGVRLNLVGIVAVMAINCIILWNAALAVPSVEGWLRSET